MAKVPYMPFYVGDWTIGTRTMTAQEKGVYIDLLAYEWDNGFIPKDLKRLEKINNEISEVWTELSYKFEEIESGKLTNSKLEGVRENHASFINKQSENGKKGGRPKTQNKPKINPTQKPNLNPKETLQTESEYDNESDNEDEGFEESEKLLTDQEKLAGLRIHDDDQWQKLWNDSSWKDKCCQLHRLTETVLRTHFDKFRLERQSATTAIDRSPPTEILKHFTHWVPKQIEKLVPRTNGFKTPQIPSFDKNE
jgi:uncharacterized protein YdaU (DUF1376 family)